MCDNAVKSSPTTTATTTAGAPRSEPGVPGEPG